MHATIMALVSKGWRIYAIDPSGLCLSRLRTPQSDKGKVIVDRLMARHNGWKSVAAA